MKGDNPMRNLLLTAALVLFAGHASMSEAQTRSDDTVLMECQGTVVNVLGVITVGDCLIKDNAAAFREVAAACQHGSRCAVRAGVIPGGALKSTVVQVYSAQQAPPQPSTVEPSASALAAGRDMTWRGYYRGERVDVCHLMDLNERGEAGPGIGNWAPGNEKVERACEWYHLCTIRARVVPSGEPVDGSQHYSVLKVYSARRGK